MSKWIEDNNYKPVGAAYEHYYNGPEFPESEMLTMIVMPLKNEKQRTDSSSPQ